jgi:hypothetical protein
MNSNRPKPAQGLELPTGPNGGSGLGRSARRACLARGHLARDRCGAAAAGGGNGDEVSRKLRDEH